MFIDSNLIHALAFMTNERFTEYSNACSRHLSSLQEEFMKLYDINSYEHWFYDHDIGAFHFKSDDGRNLYFEYVDVGSYSTERNTWMWSWNNSSTPRRATRGIEKVKAFGEQNNFKELSEGFLENGDEYKGWQLTAITANVLPAIGAYRVPHEHLFIYFIFTNELTEEEYEHLKEKFVSCDTHISGRIAFVCQHLTKESSRGFHEAFESDPLTDTPDDCQAWCDECEKVREAEDGWNEKSMSFAGIKMVCDQCYFEIKKRNLTND